MATTKKIAKKAVKPKINDVREKYIKALNLVQKYENEFTKFFPGKDINHGMSDLNLIQDYSFVTIPQSDEVIVTIKTNAGAFLNVSFEMDGAREFAESILTQIEEYQYSRDEDDDEEEGEDDGRSLEDIIAELEADLKDEANEEEGPLKKFTVISDRTFNSAWTYKVIARSREEALEMVEECPDGQCENITHMDDENVYSDDIYYSVTDEEDIEEEKPKAKKAIAKKKK